MMWRMSFRWNTNTIPSPAFQACDDAVRSGLRTIGTVSIAPARLWKGAIKSFEPLLPAPTTLHNEMTTATLLGQSVGQQGSGLRKNIRAQMKDQNKGTRHKLSLLLYGFGYHSNKAGFAQFCQPFMPLFLLFALCFSCSQRRCWNRGFFLEHFSSRCSISRFYLINWWRFVTLRSHC